MSIKKNHNENQSVVTKQQTFGEKVKEFSVVFTLFLTICGVGISVLNYFILNQLQPLYSSVEKIKADNLQVQTDLKEYKVDQSQLYKGLATKEQIDTLQSLINRRLDNLENQISFIYQKNLK